MLDKSIDVRSVCESNPFGGVNHTPKTNKNVAPDGSGTAPGRLPEPRALRVTPGLRLPITISEYSEVLRRTDVRLP